jgi:hypothetical protein
MTERRPHWDDELLFSVMSAAGDGGHLFIDDIYAVIAAVEDWQDANGFSRAGTLMHRLIDAEAAIQRVRDWCERGHYAPDTLSEWQRGFLTARREVRAILDGDGDE